MKCPICDQDSIEEYRPFCSRRCAYIDLGNWLDEDYRIDDGSLFSDDTRHRKDPQKKSKPS